MPSSPVGSPHKPLHSRMIQAIQDERMNRQRRNWRENHAEAMRIQARHERQEIIDAAYGPSWCEVVEDGDAVDTNAAGETIKPCGGILERGETYPRYPRDAADKGPNRRGLDRFVSYLHGSMGVKRADARA